MRWPGQGDLRAGGGAGGRSGWVGECGRGRWVGESVGEVGGWECGRGRWVEVWEG